MADEFLIVIFDIPIAGFDISTLIAADIGRYVFDIDDRHDCIRLFAKH